MLAMLVSVGSWVICVAATYNTQDAFWTNPSVRGYWAVVLTIVYVTVQLPLVAAGVKTWWDRRSKAAKD
jgi:hypothetical protein